MHGGTVRMYRLRSPDMCRSFQACNWCFIAGYWNNPEGTRAAFAPGGWFKTGDLAHVRTDGYVHVVDRKKDMVSWA